MRATILRKSMLVLPILLVLLLARCASPEPDANSNSAPDISVEEIRAALELLKSQPQSADDGPRVYSAAEIKAAIREHIARRTNLGIPGVFEITDPRTSRVLQLEFQKIHDPVRTLGDGLYFACTNFAAIGQPNKTYDLDFWLQPLNGELRVYAENVHKLPVRKDGEWVQQPRYDFVNDHIHLLR